jgi:hypothetical protein
MHPILAEWAARRVISTFGEPTHFVGALHARHPFQPSSRSGHLALCWRPRPFRARFMPSVCSAAGQGRQAKREIMNGSNDRKGIIILDTSEFRAEAGYFFVWAGSSASSDRPLPVPAEKTVGRFAFFAPGSCTQTHRLPPFSL